ncbi:Peroxisomal acyl-coenzyme A oxidase [Phytophthora palmivora]|uniref:acyl-CoA oxidase n=1 Tax=Phytophthora palmivora TaxID=4796 RepID=A0A2P4YRA8_9STRA|nr:Peroxisomal acyl-coenzyme A oxidase [Phytophthora palmivora]
MLMRYAKVLPDGTFIKPPSSKLVYLTMTQIRAYLILKLGFALGAATTITTRFSAVRVQGRKMNANGNDLALTNENPVLDYQNQQHALLPLVALSYAANFAGRSMVDMHDKVLAMVTSGHTDFAAQSAELHAISSGLKGWLADRVNDGIEHCRRLCGGHGFLQSSNLAHIFAENVGAVTFEGTADVLVQQHARYLLKELGSIVKPHNEGPAGFLSRSDYYSNPKSRCSASSAADFGNFKVLIEAFEVRAARSVRKLAHAMKRSGNNANSCMMLMTTASTHHTELLLLQSFISGLCQLFGVWLLVNGLGDFRQDDYISSAQADMAHQQLVNLLPPVRQNVVRLTDAWDFSDFELNSALGRFDGDVYRALVENAEKEPLNASQVPEGVTTSDRALHPMTVDNATKIMDLSPMDAAMTDYGVNILYIYAPTDKYRYNLEILRTSFIEMLKQDYPILLGELDVDSARNGTVVVKLEPAMLKNGANAVSFVTDPASIQTTEQALSSLSYDFMPPPRAGNHQLITAKCSLLADDGLAIGLDIAHGLLDGEATFTLGKVWGQYYRRLAGIFMNELETPIKLNHDRHLLTGSQNGASSPHPEFRVSSPSKDDKPPAGSPVPVPVIEGASGPLSTDQRTLHFSPDMLARLKTLASEPADAPDSSYVSTIDALTALMVVLVTRARAHGKDFRVSTCVNGRTHLQPPLPTNYVGNVIFNALSAYKAFELAPGPPESLEDTLRMVAKRIRESITRTRYDQFLRDSMAFVSSQPDMSAVCCSMDFFFGPDLFFTSWVNMGSRDADFGGGKASYAGIPRLAVGDGLIVINDPMHPNEDGLDVVVFLESETLKRFNEQWMAFGL